MDDIKWYEPLWGSWYVDKMIGEGSFGKVYRVKKVDFGKLYYSAVKIITIPQTEADLRQIQSEGMDETSARSYLQTFVADIIQEIDLMSAFRGNSNFVSLEDYKIIERTGEIGWDILIRMELLNSLSNYTAGKPLEFDEVIRLGIHMCQALELCALRNIIHRDIKPDNIFVSEYGDYKLGDFGIARQIERTVGGLSKKGTYSYMAPEVFRGYEYGADVDMYSLGIVMYSYLNNNRMPFLPDFPYPITLSNREMALQRRMRGEPLPLIKGIHSSLNAILQKVCAYDRKARFSSPTEMREALETVAGKGNLVPKVASIQPVEAKLANSKSYHNPMENTANAFGLAASGEKVWEKPPTISRTKEESSEAQTETEKLFLGKWLKAIIIPSVLVFVGIFLFVITQLQSGSIDNDTLLPFQINNQHSDVVLAPRVARIIVDLNNASISDADLAHRVAIGEIPADTMELNLFDNQISDLTPLQSLPLLEELHIGLNQISDITPLQTLTNLSQLNISGNQISDITPLQSLTNLTWLNIRSNQISDVTPLLSLTLLEELHLENNPITRSQIDELQQVLPNCRISQNPVSAVISLENAGINDAELAAMVANGEIPLYTTELYLFDNQISDITPLQLLTNLKILGLRNNQIEDITPLQSLVNLRTLGIESNQVSDITPLQSLINLTTLIIEENLISDVTPLQSLTDLRVLGLRDNQINDITPLQSLTNLTRLSLGTNQISDVTPLQTLTTLDILGLGYNQISDIAPLQSLANLTRLSLEVNQISDITPLQSLTGLTVLHLSWNQINDIEPLRLLTNLTLLCLQLNQISDIMPMQALTNLMWLDIGYNQISDITVLHSLTSLEELHLCRDQFSRSQVDELQQSLPNCTIHR